VRSGRRHAAVHAALRPAMARGVRRRHRHAAVGQSARGPASGSLCVSAIGTALQNTVQYLFAHTAVCQDTEGQQVFAAGSQLATRCRAEPMHSR